MPVDCVAHDFSSLALVTFLELSLDEHLLHLVEVVLGILGVSMLRS